MWSCRRSPPFEQTRPPTQVGEDWQLSAGSGVQVGFDLQHDLNLLAQCDAATGDRTVVADPEVGAVDLGGCREAGLGPALRVCAELGCLQGQGERLGDATDGQVAIQEELAAGLSEPGRDEAQSGVVLGVEEVRGTDVVVPRRVAGVDRGGLDRGGSLLPATAPLIEWTSQHLAGIDHARQEYDKRTQAQPLAVAR